MVADLFSRIQTRLNPYYTSLTPKEAQNCTMDKKIYMSERCSIGEFCKLFPHAREFDKPTVNEKTITPGKKNRFIRSYKRYEAKFTEVSQLNYLFGPNWDRVYHSKSVGFILAPITFRFVITEVFSHQTKLADDLSAFDVIWGSKTTHCSVNISFFRGAISRWGRYDPTTKITKEANWEEEVAQLQTNTYALLPKKQPRTVYKSQKQTRRGSKRRFGKQIESQIKL
jgi:hypothetical protein